MSMRRCRRRYSNGLDGVLMKLKHLAHDAIFILDSHPKTPPASLWDTGVCSIEVWRPSMTGQSSACFSGWPIRIPPHKLNAEQCRFTAQMGLLWQCRQLSHLTSDTLEHRFTAPKSLALPTHLISYLSLLWVNTIVMTSHALSCSNTT